MKKRILSIIALALVVASLAACGAPADAESAETPATSKHENVLNLDITSKNITTQLDPVWVNRGDLYKTLMFRSLFIATPDMKDVACDMAESYTVSEDKLTYTVVLKDNLLWHDNEPITGDDVKWSVEAAMKGSLLNSIYTTAIQLSGRC